MDTPSPIIRPFPTPFGLDQYLSTNNLKLWCVLTERVQCINLFCLPNLIMMRKIEIIHMDLFCHKDHISKKFVKRVFPFNFIRVFSEPESVTRALLMMRWLRVSSPFSVITVIPPLEIQD